MKYSRREFIAAGITGAAGSVFIPGFAGKLSRDELKIRDYRILGRTGMKVSDVSFGTGVLQEPAVIGYALDRGVNYIDTAERYHRGQSETNVGKAIKGRKREDLFITTKLAIDDRQTENSIVDRYHECLKRADTPYFDVLMLHNPREIDLLKLPAFHNAFRKLKADGKVRFAGLSCHDPKAPEICNFAIEDGRFDVLLLVYNFLQTKMAGVIRHASEKRVGTTVMKVHASEYPEQLGYLEGDRQKALQEEADKATVEFKKKYNLSESEYFRAALKWAMQNRQAGTYVMSIRNFDQAKAFISSSGEKFEKSDGGALDSYALMLGGQYCRHSCGECHTACPEGVAVNDVLRIESYLMNYRDSVKAEICYGQINNRFKPNKCETCAGHCNNRCPYGLPVQQRLVSAHKKLSVLTENYV